MVNTDAAHVTIGGVLLVHDKERRRPVAYYSRKLNDTECWYSTTDREMIAIVDCLRHFKHMLLGHSFRVCTDHKPLIVYFSKACEWTSQEARW